MGIGPHLFFTDLESGPNRGGEADAGAYVTLYGVRFTDGGTVTTNGNQVFRCPVWTDTKVTCQLGPAAQSGDLVVMVAGTASNALPFTVRGGNIYFVGPQGSDANSGNASAPFLTLKAGVGALDAGDILYVLSNTRALTDGGAALTLDQSNSGLPGAPKAVVAYPGATGIDLAGIATSRDGAPTLPSPTYAYWVFAGLTLVADVAFQVELANHWRIVGNDMSCPTGNAKAGCINSNFLTYLQFYGNHVHDTGPDAGVFEKFYHAVYLSTDSNHLDVAWNEIAPNYLGCRGIQFHSTALTGFPDSGYPQYDLHVHDNFIHDTACDALNFATIDPDAGPVEAYNNLIVHAGRGPIPDGGATFNGIQVSGPFTQVVKVYDNTLVDCGRATGGGLGLDTPPVAVTLTDNLVVAIDAGERYFANDLTTGVSGTNNLFFGAGPGPALAGGTITAAPLFSGGQALQPLDAITDFELSPGSPAVDAGIATPAATDLLGAPRTSFDLGALQVGN